MTRRRLILAALLTLAGAALGEESDQVLVTYEIPAGGGRISGVSRSMAWSATPMGDGSAHILVRLPVSSFDSGHRQFDSLVRAALEAEQHPFVEVEGLVRGGRFEGTMTLRGMTAPLSMPVRAVRAGRQLVVDTSFGFNLASFGVTIPGAGSRVIVDFVARVTYDPRAVQAGGAFSSN